MSAQAAPVLVAVGDNVVDCYPDLAVMYPGGNAVNVAVHARRCGAEASYVGAVGTDAAGELLRGSLLAEQVGTDLLRVVDGPNAYAVVRVIDGNRVFASGDEGVSRVRLSDEDLRAVAAADVVHTGECSMVEDDLARIAAAAQRLSFDFSERPWKYIETYAPLVDIAVASAPGAGHEAAQLAERIAALGPELVAVTTGQSGATVRIAGHTLHVPAGDGPVVDTLGAGDAFIARLLVGIVRDEPPVDLLTAATRYATETCAEYGAFGHRAALPATLAAAARRAAQNLRRTHQDSTSTSPVSHTAVTPL